MEPESSSQPREPIVLAYHLVAFVDVLGQGDELDKLTSLPRTEAERERVKDVLRRTAGRVLATRDGFDNMFQRFTAPLKDEFLRTVPEAERAEFSRLRQINYTNRGVSDSFIISVPLEEQRQHSYTAARGVFAALHGVAGISLIALAGGSPLRGGVDVGLAINLRSDGPYGPVLRSAYRLESRVADYPRILIGQSLIEYLESFTGRRPKDKFEEAAILIAERCLRILCRDPVDQQPMLHLVSSALFEVSPAMKPFEVKARAEAKRLLADFRVAGDVKIAGKYERLDNYFTAYPPE